MQNRAAVMTYAGARYKTTLEIAAETVAACRYAVANNLTVFRYIESSGGGGVYLLLGPGCPVSVEVADNETFIGLVERAAYSLSVDQ